MRIKTLLVDDMPLAIASLSADLKEWHKDDVDIVGTANGVMDAAKAIKKLNPELVFLDIHMGDGDGFDLLEIINNEKIAVVFTTASKDFAIQAFQVSAVDYLLKPIDPELLALSIQKAKEFLSTRTNTEVSSSDTHTQNTISLITQEEIRIVSIPDIVRLEAMGNYTQFYISDNTKVLVTKTLKDFESTLGDDFLRVHQSHLVNKSHVRAYVKTEGGYLEMKDKSTVPVSVRKKPFVMGVLSGRG